MQTSSPARGEQLHDFFREVFKLQVQLSQVMDEVHEQAGLRTPHKRLAEALEEGREMTVPQAAARLGVSRQFVQIMCNQMAAAGLLGFFDNPRHKRSRLIRLTQEGRGALNRARRKEAAIIEQVLPQVKAEEVRRAIALTALVRGKLQEEVKKLLCSRAGGAAAG